MPTIRIDEEVYAWLQKKAKPFEDTPNTVLRRVAGFTDSVQGEDEMEYRSEKSKLVEIDQKAKASNVNGRRLNKKWNVGARHALYHKEGKWYNNLRKFPGALFDPKGYVLFQDEDSYLTCKYLSVKQETNVKDGKGISSIPGYVRIE